MNEINAENLKEEDYTEASWQALQDALTAAENVLNDPDITQSEVDATLVTLNETRAGLEEVEEPPKSAESIKTRIQHFVDEGAFASNSAVRSLTIHLTAVSHYEGKEQADKVVKHMESFNHLLDYQQENGLISEEAYNVLKAETEKLIEIWQ